MYIVPCSSNILCDVCVHTRATGIAATAQSSSATCTSYCTSTYKNSTPRLALLDCTMHRFDGSVLLLFIVRCTSYRHRTSYKHGTCTRYYVQGTRVQGTSSTRYYVHRTRYYVLGRATLYLVPRTMYKYDVPCTRYKVHRTLGRNFEISPYRTWYIIVAASSYLVYVQVRCIVELALPCTIAVPCTSYLYDVHRT